MRKVIASMLVSLMLLTGCKSVPKPGGSANDVNQALSHRQMVVTTIESIYKKNYEPFYDVKALDAAFIEEQDAGESYSATILLKATKALRFTTTEELPFVKGVLHGLNIGSYPYKTSKTDKLALISKANPNMGTLRAQAVVAYLDDLYEELQRYIGQPFDAFMFLYVTASLSHNGTLNPSTISVMVEQPHYGRVPLELFRPDSAQEMYAQGKEVASYLLTKGYRTWVPAYDRWRVVEYADRYSSNATTTCPGTQVYSATLTWNNSKWPYSDLFCANDCADFASQALEYAGIKPETGMWERLRDGRNNWAWTSSSGLLRYLVHQKGYARLVLPRQVGAGGLVVTNKGHTMIVVRNDTIETLTDAHTNDRHHEPILPNHSWYYINP
ncbi:hypothetical protein HPY42_06265 [Coprothermobacteraceae bacterium]|nr:hypothetical protein [Coprothermobacteraceae bacterium]